MAQNVDVDRMHQRRLEIARRIREARRQRKLTQGEVAEMLGCSRIKINRVERGRADLTAAELDLLARGLRLPVAEFFPQ